jgi:hypothetical protein
MVMVIVVVAKDEPGLMVVAQSAGATLIAGTARQFQDLEVHEDGNFDIALVSTDQSGWIALATA